MKNEKKEIREEPEINKAQKNSFDLMPEDSQEKMKIYEDEADDYWQVMASPLAMF